MSHIYHLPIWAGAALMRAVGAAVRRARRLRSRRAVACVIGALLAFGFFAAVAEAGAAIFGFHWWIIPTATVAIVVLVFATRNIRPYVAALGLATITATAAHDEWGWPVWLVTVGYLAGLVVALGIGILIIEMRSSGVAQVVREALDRIHPAGRDRRQARRLAKLFKPTGVPFPVFGLASCSPVHRELWLKLDASTRHPNIVSAVVIDSPGGHGPPATPVRVETWPHRPGALEKDAEIGDILTTFLISSPEAGSIRTRALAAGDAETGAIWDDMVTLGRLLRSQLSPKPPDQPPITIAVDGNPEPFTKLFDGRWQATGPVRECDVEVSADALSTDELALQQVTDPLSYLHPGRMTGGSPTSPPPRRG